MRHFFKIYFWFYCVFLGFMMIGLLAHPTVTGLFYLLNIPELIAIYCFAHNTRMFSPVLWKVYFFLEIVARIFNIAFYFVMFNPNGGTIAILSVTMILLIPSMIAVYFNAFRFYPLTVEVDADDSSSNQ
jgi:hypothetical protein